jgi:hypothetical protein
MAAGATQACADDMPIMLGSQPKRRKPMETLDTPHEQKQSILPPAQSPQSSNFGPVDYEYRGFTISIRPIQDHEDLWDFEYRLSQDGAQVAPARDSLRSRTLSGHATPEIACDAGFELAKIEIDHRLAI